MYHLKAQIQNRPVLHGLQDLLLNKQMPATSQSRYGVQQHRPAYWRLQRENDYSSMARADLQNWLLPGIRRNREFERRSHQLYSSTTFELQDQDGRLFSSLPTL